MTNEPASLTPAPQGYADWLADLKGRIHTSQQRAALSVNRELVGLYWQIGRYILARQAEQGSGAKVIERLAHDLRAAFPEMKGFSPRNLKYMRAFAEARPDESFVQAVLAQLPRYHHLALLDKLPGPETRKWYIAKAIEHNWSRNVLVMQIESRLLERSGKAVTNFPATLPTPQSDLARESIKDPYRFDFLGLTDQAQEREIEDALVGARLQPVDEAVIIAGFAVFDDRHLRQALQRPALQEGIPALGNGKAHTPPPPASAKLTLPISPPNSRSSSSTLGNLPRSTSGSVCDKL